MRVLVGTQEEWQRPRYGSSWWSLSSLAARDVLSEHDLMVVDGRVHARIGKLADARLDMELIPWDEQPGGRP